MVINPRKKYSKKKYFRKRKIYRKRNKISNRLVCQRFVYKLTLAGNDTVSTGSGGITFSLTDVINSGEFTGLFDQYKIAGIKYRWVLKRNPDQANTVTYKGMYPRLVWVHDHDSAQTTATLSDLQQYNRMSEFYFGDNKMSTKWNYLKPAVANSVYNGVYNGYSAMWKKWLDCGYPAVPYYGIRYYYDALFAGITVELECKYYLAFKSVI